MMTYCGKFVLTLAHGQYIGTESPSCSEYGTVFFLCNPCQTNQEGEDWVANVRNVSVLLSAPELHTVADLIEFVREATPLDDPERRESHEHQCCIRDKKTSDAVGFLTLRALPNERGVSLKATAIVSGGDDNVCIVTMTYDEAGRVAESLHKIAAALQLGEA